MGGTDGPRRGGGEGGAAGPLREATEADIPELARMMSGLRAEDPMSRSTLEGGVAALRELLADRCLGRAFVVEEDGVAAAYVVLTYCFSLEIGGRIGFVDELFVLREYRGRGVGGRTLEAVVAEARREGLRALHLEVSGGNRAAGLYEKLGFEVRKYGLRTRYL